MRRQDARTTGLLYLFVFLLFPATAGAELIEFSLQKAIETTLYRNRDIMISSLGIDVAQEKIRSERGIYDPYISGSFIYTQEETPGQILLDVESSRRMAVETGINQLNSVGGAMSLNYSMDFQKDRYISVPLALQAHESRIYFKYAQPLLRGFGKEITNLNINRARIGKEFSEQQYQEKRSRAAYVTFNNYWILYRAIRQASIYEDVRRSSEEIHRIIQEKFKMQKLTITDLNKIEATLLQQDAEIAKRKNAIVQACKEFIFFIYTESVPSGVDEVGLLTSPGQVIANSGHFDPEGTRQKKREFDIDLISLRSDRRLLEKDLIEAADKIKPDFRVSTETGIGNINSDDFTRSVSGINPNNYNVSVQGTLMFPIKNNAAKGKYSQVEYKIRQVDLQIASKEQELDKKVEAFFDDLETVRKTLELNRRFAFISEQNLQNETERLIAEKSTLLDTLQFQTDYSNAKLALLQSEMDFILLIGTYRYFRREMEWFLAESTYRGQGHGVERATIRLERSGGAPQF